MNRRFLNAAATKKLHRAKNESKKTSQLLHGKNKQTNK
jgi:hypothetical protein